MTPAITSGQPNVECARSTPARSGVAAAARLRGTLVTLAAAARSSGGTTAITNDCRAGTSICESSARARRNAIARPLVGANAAAARKAHAGRCVYAIVRIRPMRRARCGATSCDVAPSSTGGEEHGRSRPGREPEPQVQPQHEDRRDREPAAGRVEAEERRELEHDAARRVEHPPLGVVRDVGEGLVVAAQPAVDEEEHARRRARSRGTTDAARRAGRRSCAGQRDSAGRRPRRRARRRRSRRGCTSENTCTRRVEGT